MACELAAARMDTLTQLGYDANEASMQKWFDSLSSSGINRAAAKKSWDDLLTLVSAAKEINRTNLSRERVEKGLKSEIVRRQLELLRFRNSFPAFGFNAKLVVSQPDGNTLGFLWEKDGFIAKLEANVKTCEFCITEKQPAGESVCFMRQDAE